MAREPNIPYFAYNQNTESWIETSVEPNLRDHSIGLTEDSL